MLNHLPIRYFKKSIIDFRHIFLVTFILHNDDFKTKLSVSVQTIAKMINFTLYLRSKFFYRSINKLDGI